MKLPTIPRYTYSRLPSTEDSASIQNAPAANPDLAPKHVDIFAETSPQLAESFSSQAYDLAQAADKGTLEIGEVLYGGGGKNYKLDQVLRFGALGGSTGDGLGIGGKGAYAFLLKPSNPSDPALVLYHGSYDTPSALLTLDPRGIGRALLTADGNRLNPAIAKWMQDNSGNGVVAVGHSLGGTLAALTAIYAPKNVMVMARTFSSPGVHKAAYRKWAKADRAKSAPDIVGYARENDLRASLGWRKAGKLYLVNDSKGHTDSIFGPADKPDFVGEAPDMRGKPLHERIAKHSVQADKARDEFNKSRSRPWRAHFWTSSLHRLVTTLFTPLVLLGFALKRFFIGSSQQSDGAMRHGIFAAPFVTMYDASKKRKHPG